jgi:15-cis-phytoene synthase
MNLDGAYARCEDITRHEAKNFAFGIKLLPRSKRRSLSAVYALARRIDDVGDGDLPIPEKLAGLNDLRRAVQDMPGSGADPVLLAVHDTELRYRLPLEAFDELIRGCEMDCAHVSFETFEDLVGYCRLVAGSIGRLSLAIFGTDDFEAAMPRADALGVALQLTNVLRDVREDKQLLGRVYLPREDLEYHRCSPDLADLDGNLPAVIGSVARRAESWYEEGLSLLPLLDHRSRACVATMAGIYRQVLARISANPSQVLTTRVSLSTSEKMAIAARAFAGGRA